MLDVTEYSPEHITLFVTSTYCLHASSIAFIILVG